MGNIASDGRDDVSVEIVEQDVMAGQRVAAQGYTGDRMAGGGGLGGLGHLRSAPGLEKQMVTATTGQSNVPLKSTDVKIMGHAEFDYWRKKGNDFAVEALKNSERLPWAEFQHKLTLALQHYARTPSLKLLYGESTGRT